MWLPSSVAGLAAGGCLAVQLAAADYVGYSYKID